MMTREEMDASISTYVASLQPVKGRDAQPTNENHVYLSFGSPDPGTFPLEAWRRATVDVLNTNVIDAFQYSGGNGPERIKKWIIERGKHRNLDICDEQILITAGAAQGIDFTTRLLLNPGDEVWVESPTYFFALQSFHLAGANVQMMPMDQQGIDVDHLTKELAYRKQNNKQLPKLLYCMPNFHNPTGKTLSLERRKQIVALARLYDFYIIEDDAYSEIDFGAKHLPALHSLSPSRVLYLGTFSKVIAPGIRIGWIVASEYFIRKMTLFMLGPQTSPIVQEILGKMLSDLETEAHIQKLSTCYRKKRDIMVDAIRENFGNTVTFDIPEGGFFIWIRLHHFIDADVLLEVAFENGVSFVSGSSFYQDGPTSTALRLSYSYCSQEQIKRGIALLAKSYVSLIGEKDTLLYQ